MNSVECCIISSNCIAEFFYYSDARYNKIIDDMLDLNN